MFDYSTIALTVTITALIQFGFYMLLRRPLERVDKLEKQLEEQDKAQIAGIEDAQKKEAEKRRELYERISKIELNYRQNADCIRMHADIVAMHEKSLALLIRVERAAVEISRLVSWVDDVSKEQISLGKDLAGLTATVKALSERTNEPS